MGNKSILPEDLFFSRTSDFLDVFIVKQCGRSVKTKESYRDALTVFKRYVVYTGKSILTFLYTDCTYGFLLDFKNYLSADLEYSPSSINQRLAVVKAYEGGFWVWNDRSVIFVHDRVPVFIRGFPV